jgi:N-acetylmuramoyl-L-alanine amidase
MLLNRRDMLKGAAVLTTGSVTMLTGAGAASAVTHPTLRSGSHGTQVLALQRRLTSLGYWLGTPDGEFGDLTRQSVMAIQKVARLTRDGVCGPATWAKVDAGTRPVARSRSGHVIEVNKVTQTLLVVDSGRVSRTYNTSTGSGARYLQGGTWHTAVTPSGSFSVYRRVNDWDDGPLGALYRPQYFNGGIAVHGLASVPAYPASHGCARVSLPAMNSLWRAGGMTVGTRVLVY